MANVKYIPSTVKDPDLLAQRRAEMIDVATQLFLKNGFHKTSIREIARACSFNVASLYMYVSSKEDILFLVAQHLMNEKNRALGDVRSVKVSARQAFELAFGRYCEIIDRYRPHVKLLYREMDVLPNDRQRIVLESEIAIQNLFREIIEDGIEAGEFRPVNAALAAQDAVFMAHMWSLKHWSLKKLIGFEQFVEDQLELLLGSLLVPGGQAKAAKRQAAAAQR